MSEQYSPLHTMLNPPPYCPAALVVVKIWRVVVTVMHTVAFTTLSPTSAAMVPISRMSSCAREARAPFEKPEDLVEIVIGRHAYECDYYRAYTVQSRSAVLIGNPLVCHST